MSEAKPPQDNQDLSRSVDLVSKNVDHLAAMFPEALVDGKVDFDVLRQLLGDDVEESDERYGLTWDGKRQALQLAQTPSTGTLRPCPEDSEEWETTKNLMIEGDNLEVLKLLQKSYAGKVKLIYIDPPYNTGKDFVYKDNYRDNIANYLQQTGQVDEEGNKTSTNTEASGRFHTDWLNMMYPRLKLARELLSEDGAIMISIDSSEVSNVLQICEELFGRQNLAFIASWVRTSTPAALAKKSKTVVEYVIAIEKAASNSPFLGIAKSSSSANSLLNASNAISDLTIEADKLEVGFSDAVLPAGTYGSDSYPVELLEDNEVVGGKFLKPVQLRARFRWSQEYLESQLEAGVCVRIATPKLLPSYAKDDYGRETLPNLIDSSVNVGTNESASVEVSDLLSPGVYSYPKPVSLISYLVNSFSSGGVILDFFAGSGTTGHAVMAQNAKDGGSRRFILVQLPESLDPEVKEQQAAAGFCDEIGKPRNLAELTKERLRRAAKKIAEENPEYDGDLGFRAFKLDSSNIREWDEDPENLEESLLAAENHVKEDRTDEDLLYELLLKQGIDLSEPIETKEISGHNVQSIGAGTLITCLDQTIGQEETQALGEGIAQWHEELDPAGGTTCIFRDSAFPSDVAKTNLTEILNQNNINTIRSI